MLLMTFATATPLDTEQVLALLETNHLPKAGVQDHIQHFVLVLDQGNIVGCAGLEVYQKAGLLRSVAVDKHFRSQGLGTRLVESILDLAEHKQLSSVSLLTTTAQNYFPKFGFAEVTRVQLPKSLHASKELQGACPDTAIVMMLEL
jgi:amino-acid N-acetyltransferase